PAPARRRRLPSPLQASAHTPAYLPSRDVNSSLPAAVSQTLHSSAETANCRPSGLQASRGITQPSRGEPRGTCPGSASRPSPLVRSHTWTFPSREIAASRLLSGLQASAPAQSPPPRKLRNSLPVIACQTLIVVAGIMPPRTASVACLCC